MKQAKASSFLLVGCLLLLASTSCAAPPVNGSSSTRDPYIYLTNSDLANCLVLADLMAQNGTSTDPGLPVPWIVLEAPSNPTILPVGALTVVARPYDPPGLSPDAHHSIRLMVQELDSSMIIEDQPLTFDPALGRVEASWTPPGPGKYLLIILDRYETSSSNGHYAQAHACLAIEPVNLFRTATPPNYFFGQGQIPTEDYPVIHQGFCDTVAGSVISLYESLYQQYYKSPVLGYETVIDLLEPQIGSLLPFAPVLFTYQLEGPPGPAYRIQTAYQIWDMNSALLAGERQLTLVSDPQLLQLTESWVPPSPGVYLMLVMAQVVLPRGLPGNPWWVGYFAFDPTGHLSYDYTCFIVVPPVVDTPTLTPSPSGTLTPTSTPTPTRTVHYLPIQTLPPQPPAACSSYSDRESCAQNHCTWTHDPTGKEVCQ